MKNRFATLSILLMMIAIFSGCVVTCINTPFNLASADEDKTLLGEWSFSDGKNRGSIEFRSTGSKEFQVFVKKEDQRRGPMFTGYSAPFAGRRFMQLTFVPDTEEKIDSGKILVRYETSENELHIWVLDPSKVRAAVAEGRLAGRGVGGTGEMQLTGSAKELTEAIRDEELWKKEELLRRVKPK